MNILGNSAFSFPLQTCSDKRVEPSCDRHRELGVALAVLGPLMLLYCTSGSAAEDVCGGRPLGEGTVPGSSSTNHSSGPSRGT